LLEKTVELYKTGLPSGCSTGWETLDEYYTVVPTRWTLVTGIPAHGKSELLN
jgi:twinkle protein